MTKEITKKSYQEAAKYLLHLIACALNKEVPEEKSDTCSWELIWELSTRSNVEMTIWPAVKPLRASLPLELSKKWEQMVNAMTFRYLQFDVEREQIFKKMSECKISWLPLKGILIKDYYPIPWMRYMCDNDILYGIIQPDKKEGYKIAGETEKEQEQSKNFAQKNLIAIMETLGYETENLDGNHDIFIKKPIFNFEMHKDLLPAKSEMHEYYKNPWKRAIKDDEEGFGYHFCDEDEYIFFLVHAYKHYSSGGCGLRTLADEYVFIKKKGKTLDQKYLQEELQKLNLTEFEEKIRKAADHAFSLTDKISVEDEQMIWYMIGSGTYGNYVNEINNKLDQQLKKNDGDMKAAKRGYFKKRLFISEEDMKVYYSFFYRHRRMRIFLPVYRLIKGLIIHPKKILAEMKLLKNK